MLENKMFHIAFWILISLLLSVLLLIYSLVMRKSIMPAIIPLMTVIIQIAVAEKIKGKNKYFPTNIWGYMLLNISFFLAFIFVLLYLNTLIILKIGAFVVMTLVGIYTTYNLLQNRKNKRN